MADQKTVAKVRSVERTLNILFLVAGSDKPLGLSEISEGSGIDKATAMRLLNTLEAFHLVRRDEESKKFTVGAGAWRLSNSYQDNLKMVAQPHLSMLRDTTGESVSLVAPRGLDRVVLMAIEANHELRVVPALNRVVPIYSGASGKILMAFMPDKERDRVIDMTGLKPVNERSLTDRKSFLATLEGVRKVGYAASFGDVTLGSAAVAAPIFNASGTVRAVVSIRGPEARMTSERVSHLGQLAIETAQAIGRELASTSAQPESV